MEDYTLTILGCGIMGKAVLSSILEAPKEFAPSKIYCCTGREESAKKLKEAYGDKIEVSYDTESNIRAVKESKVLVLGFKPYLCESIMASVSKGLSRDKLIISLLAGWDLKSLAKFSPFISRVMTNTPAKYGCGTAVISFSEDLSLERPEYEELTLRLTDSIGLAMKLPEKHMDVATALVGSGPAFVFLMMESMVEGAVRMGMPWDVARQCAAKVLEGSAKMYLETGENPATLKSQVCTPGGCTIAGLLAMEDKGVRGGISRAIEEATYAAKRKN